MLPERQIKNLLEHSKNMNKDCHPADFPVTDKNMLKYYINIGWIRALRMVLELNTVEEYDDDVEAKTVGTEDE